MSKLQPVTICFSLPSDQLVLSYLFITVGRKFVLSYTHTFFNEKVTWGLESKKRFREKLRKVPKGDPWLVQCSEYVNYKLFRLRVPFVSFSLLLKSLRCSKRLESHTHSII